MDNANFIESLYLRLLRAANEIKALQQELDCLAMVAFNDPEVAEAMAALLDMDAPCALSAAMDEMRHNLWFYMEVLRNGSQLGDKLREHLGSEQCLPATVDDDVMLRYLAEHRNHKPN